MADWNETVANDLDIFYSLICGAMIFFMQCGFAMLCAGSVRQKNVKNIMLKNILDAVGGALGFWSVGFAFAYESGSFIGEGGSRFFLNNYDDYIDFFFQFTFAATAATIVAGTVAERCKMTAYLCYSLFLTAFVYPIVVHAIWNTDGFLTALKADDTQENLFGIGMIDFAGSGVVHMTGGVTALVAAVILGPRLGRFYDESGQPLETPNTFPPHSVALQVLGTFILWFGWYGFNPGSTLGIVGYGNIAALCAVTTTLAAATGSASALFTSTITGLICEGEAEYDLSMAMNGCLSGLVAITANCSVVEPWAAVIIGLIAGWVYVFSSKLLICFKIDDAVDAIPVHFFNGIWGCLATGVFASPRFVSAAYGVDSGGFLYGKGGSLLACEILGVLFIVAWVVVLMFPFFAILKFLGMFRVDPLEEKVGLDISHHKGAAYNLAGPDEDVVAEHQASKHCATSATPQA